MQYTEEIWKDVVGYEGLYEVSNRGQIKSLDRYVNGCQPGLFQIKYGIKLKPYLSKGYLRVNLSKDGIIKTIQIHILVAMAFKGHRPCGLKIVVNHIDTNKLNNNDWNLELTTQRKNSNLKHIPHTSQYTGVCWYKRINKWVASTTVNGSKVNLGSFVNEYDAHIAFESYVSKILSSYPQAQQKTDNANDSEN